MEVFLSLYQLIMLSALRPTGHASGNITDCITGCSLDQDPALERGKLQSFVGLTEIVQRG